MRIVLLVKRGRKKFIVIWLSHNAHLSQILLRNINKLFHKHRPFSGLIQEFQTLIQKSVSRSHRKSIEIVVFLNQEQLVNAVETQWRSALSYLIRLKDWKRWKRIINCKRIMIRHQLHKVVLLLGRLKLLTKID
jgi:hypothetical protein